MIGIQFSINNKKLIPNKSFIALNMTFANICQLSPEI